MSKEVFIPIVRHAAGKLMRNVPHAVQPISVVVAPDGGTKIAAERHTETSRCPISI